MMCAGRQARCRGWATRGSLEEKSAVANWKLTLVDLAAHLWRQSWREFARSIAKRKWVGTTTSSTRTFLPTSIFRQGTLPMLANEIESVRATLGGKRLTRN